MFDTPQVVVDDQKVADDERLIENDREGGEKVTKDPLDGEGDGEPSDAESGTPRSAGTVWSYQSPGIYCKLISSSSVLEPASPSPRHMVVSGKKSDDSVPSL